MVYQVGVGGYHQEIDVLREAWPDVRFVGFDPIRPDTYDGEFIQTAIGRTNGEASFYVKRRHQDGSSLFPLGADDTRRVQSVPIVTLDELLLFSCPIGEHVLLWLDCEGSELDALVGGERFIRYVEMVNVELSAAPRLAGMADPLSVYRWLAERGFYMIWCHTMRIPDGQWDAIFVRQELFSPECCCYPSETLRYIADANPRV